MNTKNGGHTVHDGNDAPIYSRDDCMGWPNKVLIAVICACFALIAFSPLIAQWIKGWLS